MEEGCPTPCLLPKHLELGKRLLDDTRSLDDLDNIETDSLAEWSTLSDGDDITDGYIPETNTNEISIRHEKYNNSR